MIVVGSVALKWHLRQKCADSLSYLPKDLDLIGSVSEVNCAVKEKKIKRVFPAEAGKKMIGAAIGKQSQTDNVEIELTWPSSTAEMFRNLVMSQDDLRTLRLEVGPCWIPNLDLLYTLKMSHRFKKDSKHFLKTMKDIKLMRQMGAGIPKDYQDFYKARMEETYNYAHPKLNQPKADFFNGDGINYVYDHDSLHEVVKTLAKPAYTFFKPKDKEVLTSKSAFDMLPHRVKLYSVLEESYVLALERSQIPFGNRITPRESFLIALEKVCTSIASGWWREFAWEHYDEVLSLYNDVYLDRFIVAEQLGRIKPFRSK